MEKNILESVCSKWRVSRNGCARVSRGYSRKGCRDIENDLLGGAPQIFEWWLAGGIGFDWNSDTWTGYSSSTLSC